MDQIELIDVIDENNKVIDVKPKNEVHKLGLAHRISAVLVYDGKKILIPKAADSKVEASKLFHSSAGHVISGEDYYDAAIRELKEECNLTINKKDMDFLGSFWLKKNYVTRIENERFEVYKVQYNSEMGKVKLNEEHIDPQWLTLEEIIELYENTPEKISYPLYLSLKEVFNAVK